MHLTPVGTIYSIWVWKTTHLRSLNSKADFKMKKPALNTWYKLDGQMAFAAPNVVTKRHGLQKGDCITVSFVIHRPRSRLGQYSMIDESH